MTPLLSVLALTLVQEPPPPAASEGPRLLFEDLDGRVTEVPAANLTLHDPRERGAWVVRTSGFAPAGPPLLGAPGARFVLAGGDELRGRIKGGSGERLELELSGGVSLSIEIGELQRVFPDYEPRLDDLAPAAEGDRLYRRTSGALDSIDGTVESFSDEGVRFDSVLGPRTFPWNEVAALLVEVLEPESGARDETRPPVIVDLADGSRVRGALVELTGERCVLALHGVPELSLALSGVSEITVDDGRLVHLSDVEPAEESGRGAPFGDELGMSWPHRMDESVMGGPLRVRGRETRRGIGMHAPSRLTFRLDGSFRALRASVAIDDSALSNGPGARGSCIFRAWLDGKEVWESPLVRGSDEPLALLVELGGARELVLEVDPAGDFAGDRADWLRPILVR